MAKRKKRGSGKKSRHPDAPKSDAQGQTSAVAPSNPPQRQIALLVGSLVMFAAWLVALCLLVWQRLVGA